MLDGGGAHHRTIWHQGSYELYVLVKWFSETNNYEKLSESEKYWAENSGGCVREGAAVCLTHTMMPTNPNRRKTSTLSFKDCLWLLTVVFSIQNIT